MWSLSMDVGFGLPFFLVFSSQANKCPIYSAFSSTDSSISLIFVLNLLYYMYLFTKCKDCCCEFILDSYSLGILFIALVEMYLYAFDEYVGTDRIFSAPDITLPVGSLFVSQGRKYLVL